VFTGRFLPKIEPYGLAESDLSFEEGLEIAVHYRTQAIKDDTTTTDRKGLTTRQHELEHVRIDTDAWNAYAVEANEYERSYRCKECAQKAREIVKTLRSLALAKMASENDQLDWDAYAKDSPLEHNRLEQQMNRDAINLENTELELDLDKNDFQDAGCR
jgi:hypothetical protein